MESSQNNPYQTPEAELTTDVTSEPNQSGIFSLSGRIGRLRYLAYLMVIYLLTIFSVAIVGVVAGLMSPDSNEGGSSVFMLVAMGVVYLPLLFYVFALAVRRLNDIGWSGWTSLLMLIPIVGAIIALVMLFKKGDEGVNKYGAQPRPNSTGVKIAAFSFILIPVFGILAAIAIPAYSDYSKRAASSIQSQP